MRVYMLRSGGETYYLAAPSRSAAERWWRRKHSQRLIVKCRPISDTEYMNLQRLGRAIASTQS